MYILGQASIWPCRVRSWRNV